MKLCALSFIHLIGVIVLNLRGVLVHPVFPYQGQRFQERMQAYYSLGAQRKIGETLLGHGLLGR